MVKLYTKELAGRLLVDITLKRAEDWLATELNILRNTPNNIICVPLPNSNNSWAIGKYQLDNLGNNTWRLHYNDNIDCMFYSRKSAIAYAILTQQNQYKSADHVLQLDQLVSKSKEELMFFSKKMLVKQADSFKLQLYEIRYSDSKALYIAAKEELEKTLSQAKYIKVWKHLL